MADNADGENLNEKKTQVCKPENILLAYEYAFSKISMNEAVKIPTLPSKIQS